jgi:hypothetical protein
MYSRVVVAERICRVLGAKCKEQGGYRVQGARCGTPLQVSRSRVQPIGFIGGGGGARVARRKNG